MEEDDRGVSRDLFGLQFVEVAQRLKRQGTLFITRIGRLWRLWCR